METILRFSRSRGFWIFFFTLAVLFYFYGLNVPFLGPDEPRYAQVAREMFERGDWVTTTLGGFNWFEKPALLYWYQITAFNIFGVSEFAARLGSALSGLGIVLFLWLAGRFSFEGTSKTREEKIEIANWFGMVAATSLGIIAFARGASFDITLSFPVTASLACFMIYDRSVKSDLKSRWLPLFGVYFFVGVGLLAKGLVGAVLPAAVIGFYYLLSLRFPPMQFIISAFWGGLVAVAVASLWYVPMYLTNGWEFIDQFFIQHHFQRYTSNKYLHPMPFWFFWVIFPLFVMPWLPFFFVGVWKNIKNLFGKLSAENADDIDEKAVAKFAFAWMLFPLIFFSFSGSKLPGYILPAVPGAVILTALFIKRFAAASDIKRLLIQSVAVGMLLVCFGILTFVMPGFAETDSVKVLIQAADERGYKDAKIISYRFTSHSAEFYAAGRLSRRENGKQKEFNDQEEISEYMHANADKPLLILVEIKHINDLKAVPGFKFERLRDNTRQAIVSYTKE